LNFKHAQDFLGDVLETIS